jgi:hypothetical protein
VIGLIRRVVSGHRGRGVHGSAPGPFRSQIVHTPNELRFEVYFSSFSGALRARARSTTRPASRIVRATPKLEWFRIVSPSPSSGRCSIDRPAHERIRDSGHAPRAQGSAADLTVVGDSAYGVIERGLACRRRGLRLIAPLRLDARLLTPAPPRAPRDGRSAPRRGRPPPQPRAGHRLISSGFTSRTRSQANRYYAASRKTSRGRPSRHMRIDGHVSRGFVNGLPRRIHHPASSPRGPSLVSGIGHMTISEGRRRTNRICRGQRPSGAGKTKAASGPIGPQPLYLGHASTQGV